MEESGEVRRRRLALRRRKRKKRSAVAMSMMEHLSELRSRLIFSLAAFLVLSVVAFVFFNQISDFLLRPLCSLPEENLGPNGCRLIFTSALEPVTVRLKVTAMVGIVAASPIWLYQVWAFIVPGLHPKEKKYAIPFVFISVFLFAIGAVFAYVTLPSALRFLVSLGGENLIPFFSANEYLSFIGLIVLVFGVTFEAPLLLFFLGLVGVVNVAQLRGFRRSAIVGITVIAAVVTPSQDPYTMLAMAVPLYLFYEGTILALAVVARRRARRSATEI
ncbi:MAG: twin-arginine translocase subunit TatC [Actinomycetota bacterium]